MLWSELARYRKSPGEPDPTETPFDSFVDSVFERVAGQLAEEEGGGHIEVTRSEVAEAVGRMGLRVAIQ